MVEGAMKKRILDEKAPYETATYDFVRWAAGGGRHVLLTSLDVEGASHVASQKHWISTLAKLEISGSTTGKFTGLGAGSSAPFLFVIPRQRAVWTD